MRSMVQHLAWIVAMIYAAVPVFWFLIHPLVDFWRRQKRSPYWVLLPAQGLTIALGLLLTWPWHRVTLYDTPYAWIAALPFIGTAMFIFRNLRPHFTNQQMVGRNELAPDRFEQRLVTTGPHARVRHPIYGAHFLMLVGWTVGSGLLVCYAMVGFALVAGTIMITLEERELERRFGDQFREYKRRVPAFLPRRSRPSEPESTEAPRAL
ncbi:MAG: methyltransferase family protein [Terriglobales bacterium]